MVARKKITTKDLILQAAKEVFAEKGKHGAGMEEIAERAQVNKRMVYYYFNDKENLFREIIKFQFQTLFFQLTSQMREAEIDLNDPVALMKFFTRVHFNTIIKDREGVRILLSSLASEPNATIEIVRPLFEERGDEVQLLLKSISGQMQGGISDGQLRDVNIRQVLLSIVGMNLFYIFGKPIAEMMFGANIEDEELFLQERLNSIIDLYLYGIVERGSAHA